MKTFFVTRHTGALDWAQKIGLIGVTMVEHLVPDEVGQGDLVIGTLPVHIVAQICKRGARYMHLSMNIPKELRGRELSCSEMESFGARLEEYRVQQVALSE